MIDVQKKEKCCGCGVCSTVCPTNSISIVKDKLGFERVQVNIDTCINCEKCLRICPIQGGKNLNRPQKAYIVQNKDNYVRKDSTSGGAFTPFGEFVISKGGIVYGAVMDGHNAVHLGATKESFLARMRNSKYTQSTLTKVLSDNNLDAEIKSEKMVLFSGTPCQVNAIKNKYSNYHNLYTIEVMCREVATPLLLEKYLEYQKKRTGIEPSSIRFRDKHYGYHYSVLNLKYNDNSIYHKPLNYDPYLKAFFSNNFARESCFVCPYRKVDRGADISIWDAWDISKCNHLKQDDWGATKIFLNTEKGLELFELCKDCFYIEECTVEDIIGSKEMFEEDICKQSDYENQRYDLMNMPADKFFRRYYPITLLVKIRNMVKTFLYRSKLIRFY